MMIRPGSARVTFVLAFIAAALALAGAVVGYSRTGDVRWSLVAAAIFLIAFGIGARNRSAA